MTSHKHRVLMAGLILATAASTLSAHAADQSTFFDQQRQITDGYSRSTVPAVGIPSAKSESAQFESFENQLSQGTVANITPSERGESGAQSTTAESPQYESFEHQLSSGSVANFTPSERAN